MDRLNDLAFSHLVCKTRPFAGATLRGNADFPHITGTVWFYPAIQGALVVAEVFALPSLPQNRGYGPFYGFHLHAGSSCGNSAGEKPFAAAGTHFQIGEQSHPGHAGDFPVLLGNDGYAYLSFYTDRITPEQAVGKTVIVHQRADDYRTPPSGDSGMMLACGEVRAIGM